MGGMGGRRGCALEGTRPPGPGDSRCLFSYVSSIFLPPGGPRPPPAPPALPRGRPAPPLNTATTQDTE